MAFSGGTRIIFCNVPIDNSYKHQFTFTTQSQQETYFDNKKLYEKENYLMVHRTNETKNRQYMRVYLSFDDVRKCNYCAYFNQSAELAIDDKWIYAFITDYFYKSDEVTEIEIEVDVWNTYQKDISIKHCLIEREHTNNDTIGENVLPENVDIGDYITTAKKDVTFLKSWCVLIGSTVFLEESLNFSESTCSFQDNKVTGLQYYAYDVEVTSGGALAALNTDIERLNTAGKIDALEFMIMFPTYFLKVGNLPWSTTERNRILETETGYMFWSANRNKALDFSSPSTNAHYVPKNNKLYTFPYTFLYLTNNEGNYSALKYERFFGNKGLSFRINTILSSDPRMICFPENYNGEIGNTLDDENEDDTVIYNGNTEEGVVISNFPICDWAKNTVLNWFANNNMQLALNTISSIMQIAGGVALSSTAAGALSGASQISAGALGLGGVLADVHTAKIQPPQARGGAGGGSLNLRLDNLNFSFYNKSISYVNARIIDDYFTKYGYKTYRLKTPNITGRKFWNYVKTNDCIITGNIANDEKNKIMQMFNDGVTFWHYANDGSTTDFHVGDYSLENEIV